jgi:hypothetical protein
MNEVAFPSVVDFGLRAAGETHRRTIAMTCKTPIAFEFELALTTESGAFDVRPRRGIVPANGAAEIEITYAPTKLQTTVTDVVVKVSQFGFEPMRCSLRGTGFPSARRDDARRPPFEDRGSKKTRGGTLLHASDVGLQSRGSSPATPSDPTNASDPNRRRATARSKAPAAAARRGFGCSRRGRIRRRSRRRITLAARRRPRPRRSRLGPGRRPALWAAARGAATRTRSTSAGR